MISIELKKEKWLEAVSYQNQFYLLTMPKDASIIKLTQFSDPQAPATHEFHFSSFPFHDPYHNTLYGTLNESVSTFGSAPRVQKIDIDNPNPLDLTSSWKKLYCFNDKIYISLDNNVATTSLISFDLKDMTSEVSYFDKAKIPFGELYNVGSNSFLTKDKLFQIKASKRAISLQITDLASGIVLQEMQTEEKGDIEFKNTPLIQEGGTSMIMQGAEQELSKTKQILRKISNSDIGLSVYSGGEQLELTLGGFKEVERTQNLGGMMPGMGIPLGGGFFFDPTMLAYASYTNTRAVYFKTLLDSKELSHIPGEILRSSNIFDYIRTFDENQDFNVIIKTIFKVDDYFVLGYYHDDDNQYILRKFEVE